MTKVIIKGFTEEKTEWNDTDFRFCQKGNMVYAFIMANLKNNIEHKTKFCANPNSGAIVLKSFNEGEKIISLRLLGRGNLDFSHNYGILSVKLPDNLPTNYVNCLAVELA